MCCSKGFQSLTSQTACFGSEGSFPPIWDYFDLFAYFMIAITLSLWDQQGPQEEHVNPTVNNGVRSYFLKFDCRAANIVSMFSKWEYKPRLFNEFSIKSILKQATDLLHCENILYFFVALNLQNLNYPIFFTAPPPPLPPEKEPLIYL